MGTASSGEPSHTDQNAEPSGGGARLMRVSSTGRMRYAAAVTYVASVAFGFGAAVTGCQSGPPDGTAVGIFVRAGGPVPGPPVPLAGKVTAAPAGGGSA